MIRKDTGPLPFSRAPQGKPCGARLPADPRPAFNKVVHRKPGVAGNPFQINGLMGTVANRPVPPHRASAENEPYGFFRFCRLFQSPADRRRGPAGVSNIPEARMVAGFAAKYPIPVRRRSFG
ncbi:hypothetical protein GN316_11735 [Xylophilus sp. Kf1]|nr:hypothetical protein [Xylophilus sp. Kf1]